MSTEATPLPAEFAALPFEAAYERLKSLTAELEADKMPLEESLKAYEEATLLHRRCQELLQAAENRIQMLQNGAWTQYPDSADE